MAHATAQDAAAQDAATDAVADAVVIGSGHNGLVAACHLARAGLRVEVVESDPVLGGAVSTVERWPGVRVDRGSSAHVIIRHSGVIEELGLEQHGLRYIDCDPWGFAPAPVPGDPGPDPADAGAGGRRGSRRAARRRGSGSRGPGR
jgi:phytoene dehydrogenase-like protein